MNSQPSIMIAVDQSSMQKLLEEMAALRRAVEKVNMSPRPEWITVDAFAAKIGRTKQTVRLRVRQGKIDSKRIGGVLHVRD